MKISVDRDLCEGHAECVDLAGELFRLDDNGLAEVLVVSPSEDQWRSARAAATFCPAGAILIEDDA